MHISNSIWPGNPNDIISIALLTRRKASRLRLIIVPRATGLGVWYLLIVVRGALRIWDCCDDIPGMKQTRKVAQDKENDVEERWATAYSCLDPDGQWRKQDGKKRQEYVGWRAHGSECPSIKLI